MAILTKGTTFADGTAASPTNLNNLVDAATFASGAVDGSTTQLSGGAIIVKDGGITPSKLSNGAPSWSGLGIVTATSIQSTPIGTSTPAAGKFTTLQATSTTTLYEAIEKATVTATAPSSTTNFNVLDGSVVYYTTAATTNWTLNVRGDGSTSLNSTMATGDSMSFAVLTTQGSTAYYHSALTIDGNAVTPKWSGGTAPTAGNASGIDSYTFTIIKTASATFTVLASQTRFA